MGADKLFWDAGDDDFASIPEHRDAARTSGGAGEGNSAAAPARYGLQPDDFSRESVLFRDAATDHLDVISGLEGVLPEAVGTAWHR
jgi:hypothetical protein